MIYQISIENQTEQPIIHANVCESNRVVSFEIVENIDIYTKIQVNLVRADGITIKTDAVILDNHNIQFIIPANALIHAGRQVGQVLFYDTFGGTAPTSFVASFPFEVHVAEQVVSADTIYEQDYRKNMEEMDNQLRETRAQIEACQQLIQQVTQLVSDLQDSSDTANLSIRLTSVENALNDANSDIEALQQKDIDLQNHIDGAYTQMSGISQGLVTTSNALSTVSTRLEEQLDNIHHWSLAQATTVNAWVDGEDKVVVKYGVAPIHIFEEYDKNTSWSES